MASALKLVIALQSTPRRFLSVLLRRLFDPDDSLFDTRLRGARQ
jgi:hypothetical protein